MTYSSNSNLHMVASSEWDENSLSNAMMTVSLSETMERRGSVDMSPLAQSHRMLNGWGNQTTRQTYRSDLCSLSQGNVAAAMMNNHQHAAYQGQPQVSVGGDYFNFDL